MRIFKSLISVALSLSLCSCAFFSAPEHGSVSSTADSDSDTVSSYVDPAAPEDGGLSLKSDSAGHILDYFAEVAFGSEFGDNTEKLCRWESEILYTVTGECRDGDIELIGILVDRLNSIEGFPQMREAGFNEDANFEIMFITRAEITELFDEANENCAGMSEYHWYTDSCEIFKARAAIDCNEEEERLSTICEELLQSLGLAKDSYAHRDSVFYQGKCIYSRPSELDYAMVELLYHPKLKAGMSRYEAITAAAGLLKW